MTIIGIAGCTGLMLTGFGIRDSVDDIPNAEFKEIFKYDATITLSNTDNLPEIEEYLQNNENIESYVTVFATTAKLSNGSKNYNVTVFVPENLDNYTTVYNLIDYKTGDTVSIENDGIIITDKIAEMLEISAGDNIIFIDADDNEYQFKVNNIVQNHVSHYVYMSKEFYENNLKQYQTNIIYFNTKDISEERTK